MGKHKGNRWSWLSAESFLHGIDAIETIVSKLMSIAMLVVIFVIMIDLVRFLAVALWEPSPEGFFKNTLSEIFGLFLSVLIALEILEKIGRASCRERV